jgi:hypothetical protein
MALTSATITRTPSVIVSASVENFTAAPNEPVVVAYAPSASGTVAPTQWFERPPYDAVSRALLGPGHIWAKIVRVDRGVDGVRDFESIEVPVATW